MSNIVVTGYPKSGNTWAARLIGELVGCPVAGFWHSDDAELAQEGLDRSSELRCYKSHHTLDQLQVSERDKVIMVMRDPRDIVISGANYFAIEPFPVMRKFFCNFPCGLRLYTFGCNSIFKNWYYQKKLNEMIRAVLYGAEDINPWLKPSWQEFVTPYLNSKTFVLRYEQLLKDPVSESNRILNFLGIYRAQEEVENAVEAQSFSRRKKEFELAELHEQSAFLRSGSSGQWKHELSKAQISLFEQELGEKLKELGFDRPGE